MKRVLLGTLFLAAFGLALAGPPVDYQLYCEVVVDEVSSFESVGVASEVEGERQVMLVDGALGACDGEVVVEGEGERVFVTVAGYPLGVEPGTVDSTFELRFEWVEDAAGWIPDEEADDPVTTIDEVPQVAVDGKLGAMQNRAEAFQRAEEARARAEERAAGPPMDVPGEGDDEGAEEVVEIEGEEDGPPMELPEPATRGRP
jgi:hypothetical protein